MFLCDECHKSCGCFTMFRSHGACESCGRRAACVDCRAHHRRPLIETGRTSQPPPVQNIPLRTPLGRELRAALRPNYITSGLDYSELESLMLAFDFDNKESDR